LKRGGPIGPEVSMLKIWNTETQHRVMDLMLDVAAECSGVTDPIPVGDGAVSASDEFIDARPSTIYGGSNQIQRNILSKAVLRLPS